jgi:hypothetical protein
MGYEFAMFAAVYISLVRRRGLAGLAGAAFILTPVFIWAFPGSLAYMPRMIAVIVLLACVGHWRQGPPQVEEEKGTIPRGVHLPNLK